MSHFIAFSVGAIGMLLFVAAGIHGHRNECRAAHPGLDCEVGWVVSEPFK